MNVKQLKEQLAGVPDEALVVLRASDHAYRGAYVDSTHAIQSGRHLSEDFGEDAHTIARGDKRVPVLLFS